PVTPAREVEGRTLSAVVEDFVLRQYAADVAVFGRLHLLTAGYLSSVPLQAAAALLDLSDAATRQLPADSATGRWARGWKGAYVYAAPSVDRSSVLRARYHAKARAVAADLVTLLQESTKNYLWGARIFTLLRKRYGSEPGEPAEFELLLEELKAQGFFDALFDAGDSTGIGLDMYLVRFSRGTRYQDDPRIKQSIELRNRRRREEWLKHRYFEDSKVIWLDGWSQQAMHVGEEATIAWGYWNKIVDKRLIEQRQKDLQEAIARIAPGFMGKIFRGEDKAEYKDANAVMEAISAAAAKEIGLKESDFEEVLVGQRSLRLKDVQKLPEGGYDRYYVTYQFVERKVEASWIEVGDPTVVGKWIEAGDPITVPDSEFEWLLWGWRYQHEAAILLFASKIVVAVSFAPMALVAFPVLIEAAGGALALTISVAVSEIMYVGVSLYRGKQLSANGFIEA